MGLKVGGLTRRGSMSPVIVNCEERRKCGDLEALVNGGLCYVKFRHFFMVTKGNQILTD